MQSVNQGLDKVVITLELRCKYVARCDYLCIRRGELPL